MGVRFPNKYQFVICERGAGQKKERGPKQLTVMPFAMGPICFAENVHILKQLIIGI